MQSPIPLHPVVVHFPIALLLVSVLFEVVGRATDSEWWRKGSFALLALGTAGTIAALLTGEPDAERAVKMQAVPEAAIESHENAGKLSMWLGIGAVVTRSLAASGGARALAVIAFVLQVAAAAAVGIAGFRGGELVYRHGAGVAQEGELIHSTPGETAPTTANTGNP